MIELTANQQEAIERIDQDMLVTAGAGSGKTMVLVRRFVEILNKSPQLSVRKLLAVTYTRKAAKEMRTRIKAQLKKLFEQATEPAVKRRWQQALSEMDVAHIETIHSLSQKILRNFAVYAGVDSNIDLLDDVEQAQVVEDTIKETLRQAINLQEADHAFVTHFSPDEITEILKAVLKSHLQFNQLLQQAQKLSIEDLKTALQQSVLRLQKQYLVDLSLDEQWRLSGNYINHTSCPSPGNTLDTSCRAAAACFSEVQSLASSASAQAVNGIWLNITNLADMRKPSGASKDDATAELKTQLGILIERARLFVEKLPSVDTTIDEQYWRLWTAFLHIAQRVLRIYKNNKQQLQKTDFDDLIAGACAILNAKNSPVRSRYNEIFSHILVDEFQDTNAVQASLIKTLAGPETKLFFIGDDKQSIYKFQGADLSTFNALRKEMNEGHDFEDSFRSVPDIVDFVNKTFARMLHADLAHTDYRAKYKPLKAKRDGNTSNGHEAKHVEIIQLPTVDRQQSDAFPPRMIEGLAVADWIKTKVEQKVSIIDKSGDKRPINYGDFAVLVPGNNDFTDIESALSQHSIPYVTSGGKTFLQRQEIYDLENMLLFLTNPSDSHALFGILRSPMFALSDDLIHQIMTVEPVLPYEEPETPDVVGAPVSAPTSKRNHFENTLWQSLQNYALQHNNQLISEAVMTLKNLLADLSTLTLSQLLYKIIRKTNYDLSVLSLADGKQRYKNIWKLHSMSGQKDDLSATEFAEYLDSCRRLSVHLSNAPVDTGHSVKLMTIHAAKGLEFPAVALPRLSSQGRIKEDKLLFDRQFGIALNTARSSEEKEENTPVAYVMSKVLSKDMDIAEKKRLFYVAMTRARDYLGVFIKEKDRKGENMANWLRPLLDLSSGDTAGSDSGLYKPRPYSVHQPTIDSLTKAIVIAEPKNLSPSNGSLDSQIDDRLIEPIGAHVGVSESVRDLEIRSRITPQANKKVEPDNKITGTYFHKMMEYLPSGEKTLPEEELSVLAAPFAAHPQILQALIVEGKKLLTIFADSNLQMLLASAKIVCHEWPYYMEATQKRKIPDLLLQSADGTWYVIDYKTDHFDISDIERQTLRHRSQLEQYGKDLTTLTGITPKLAIYFAQHGLLYELDLKQPC